jgi:hypothetical protein
MSYAAVMKLAKERPISDPTEWNQNGIDWLAVVKGCYEESQSSNGGQFAGAWVQSRVNFSFPGLRFLTKNRLIVKVGDTVRTGTKAYYIMPDMEGVARALNELGYLEK